MSNTTTSAQNHGNHRNSSSPQQGDRNGNEATTGSRTIFLPKPKYIVPSQLALARGGAEFMSVNAPIILAVWELSDLKKDLKNRAMILLVAAGVVGYLSFDCARILMRGFLFKALLFVGFLCEFSLLLVLMGEMMWGQETIQAPYMLIPASVMSLLVVELNSLFSTKESFVLMKLLEYTGCKKLCQILRLPTLEKWMNSLFLLCCMLVKFLMGKVISFFQEDEVWEVTEPRGRGLPDLQQITIEAFGVEHPRPPPSMGNNHLRADTADFFYFSLQKFLYKNMNLMLLESFGIMALIEAKQLFKDVQAYILCCTIFGTVFYYVAISASRGPWLIFLASLGNAMKMAIWLVVLGSLKKKPAYYVGVLLLSIVVSLFPLTYRYYVFKIREEIVAEATSKRTE